MRIALLFLFCCVGCQMAQPVVKEVVSADTVVLNDGTRLHYAGLAAPPKESKWFGLCRDANAYLVRDKTVKYLLEPGLSKDGEKLAYLYTQVLVGKETKFLFVNAEMVRFGFAFAQPPPKDCEHKALWQNLWDLQEKEARPLKRGIWSGNPSSQKPKE